MQPWKAPPLPSCLQPTLLPGLFALIRRCDSYLSSRITVTERDGHCGQSWRTRLRLEGNTIHASSAVNPPSAISSGMRGGVIRETGGGKMRRKNKGGAGQEVKRGVGGVGAGGLRGTSLIRHSRKLQREAHVIHSNANIPGNP